MDVPDRHRKTDMKNLLYPIHSLLADLDQLICTVGNIHCFCVPYLLTSPPSHQLPRHQTMPRVPMLHNIDYTSQVSKLDLRVSHRRAYYWHPV